MPHAYTEDQLVEQPAIGLFAELGWTTVSALEETSGTTGTLRREAKGEVAFWCPGCRPGTPDPAPRADNLAHTTPDHWHTKESRR